MLDLDGSIKLKYMQKHDFVSVVRIQSYGNVHYVHCWNVFDIKIEIIGLLHIQYIQF